VLCLFARPLPASPPIEGVAEIKAASHALIGAQLRYDAASMARLLTQDFVYVGNDGAVVGRVGFLPTAADLKQRPLKLLEWNLVQVRFHGNSAVALYTIHEKGIQRGKPYEFRGHSLATWVQSNGKWFCAAIHD
jgi:uncharacterized protein (TIGR02246 family)